ncbi:MAG: hypothetical protein JWP34_4733, partial [Massilia sp.]|nr:hypothetical protein [Massilia sp.]
MDFNTIFQDTLPTSVANLTNNGTDTSTHDIAATLRPLLGAYFGPLLNLFTMVGERFGLDPLALSVVLGLLWAGRGFGTKCWSILKAVSMCSVTAYSDDDIGDHIKHWISQPGHKYSLSVTAETANEGDHDPQMSKSGGPYLNFAQQAVVMPPRFTPSYGAHGFWLNWRYFWVERQRHSTSDRDDPEEVEVFTIRTWGWSLKPVKKFLQLAKEEFHRGLDNKTIIRTPTDCRYNDFNPWKTAKKAPIRPVHTVVMDPKQKARLIDDINSFLQPSTQEWYGNRGIPYRRGYLLYGPPGTGKTSLCSALAGLFGLPLHIIPRDASVTDNVLAKCFRALPPRCIVLLEDIDAGGLTRRPTTIPGEGRAQRRGPEDGDTAYSLSGLLNAIDGAATHEGHILFMTTNNKEALDNALIRPGRVDMQFELGNATKEQAKELFLRINGNSSQVSSSNETLDQGLLSMARDFAANL